MAHDSEHGINAFELTNYLAAALLIYTGLVDTASLSIKGRLIGLSVVLILAGLFSLNQRRRVRASR